MTLLQQAQRAAANLQENKKTLLQHAEEAQSQRKQQASRENMRRHPASGSPPQPTVKPQGKATHHLTEHHDKTRRMSGRTSPAKGETLSGKHTARSESAEKASLFSTLLDSQYQPLMAMSVAHLGWEQSPLLTSDEPSVAHTSNPMVIWQQLETSLTDALAKQPASTVSLTLLLPKLGEVDARLSRLSGEAGWDISLRFTSQVLTILAPHHERCRESLRRRMASRVRLNFEQRVE